MTESKAREARIDQARRAAKKAHFDDVRPESAEGKKSDFDAGFSEGVKAALLEADAEREAAVKEMREKCASICHIGDAACIRALPLSAPALDEVVRKARLEQRERCTVALNAIEGGYSIDVVSGKLIPDNDGPWFLKSDFIASLKG